MPTSPLPLSTSLDTIYSSAALLQQGKRWDTLAQEFEKEFGVKPQKVSRAPGRVNVIGEHIDYCGFSVLPAAIERDVLIAFSTEPKDPSNLPKATAAGRTVVILRNLDAKYGPTHFEVDLSSWGADLPLPKKHHWSSYFIAGCKGILQHLHEHPAKTVRGREQNPSHVCIMVWGTVPEGSGLSSSSAMTTASAIAILEVLGRRDGNDKVGRREVTEVAIESERLVGVNSGGMDQSASVFSRPLHLLHIEFVPKLQATAIPLPETNPPFSFVIANTLVTSNKQLTAKFCYNLRVVETRLGALLLAKALDLPPQAQHAPPLTYKTLLDNYFSRTPTPAGPHHKSEPMPTVSPPEMPTAAAHPSSPLPPQGASKVYELKTMLGLAGKELGGPGMEEGLTWDQVAEQLGRDKDDLIKEVVGKNEVEPVNGKLKIWTRARHVFSEALRVYEFRELLETEASGETTLDSSDLLQGMGDLMNASMLSCQTDFECSCPELDELIALARENGAIGSRLTGAGWGGATVSLVPEPKVSEFIKAIREGYYAKQFPNLTEEELADVCFATKPEAGAGVYAF